MSYRELKVNALRNQAEYRDEEGDTLEIGFWSNGVAVLTVNGKKVELTNRAAHEVRDFFCQRYPNATAVQ